MKSIIIQVWAVIQVSQTEGKLTPGVDKKAFKSVPSPYTCKSEEHALTYLDPRIARIKKYLSIAKGKTDQVIRRRKANNSMQSLN